MSSIVKLVAQRIALGIVLVLLADDPTEEIGLIPGGRGGIITLQPAL